MSDTNLIEKKCDRCDGEGQVRECGEWCECGTCDGLGIITTTLGDEVQSIIWRVIRAMQREEARHKE